MFDPGSILVRRRLVASKQSSLDANCVRLTYFLRWMWITLQTQPLSRGIHVLLLISIRVFFRLYQRFFAEYWQKVHSLNSAQFTGLDTVYGKVPWTLDFWDWPSSTSDSLPRVGDVNISFPGVGVNIRFPRVGDVNISPGWVSSTSDQSQEWRSSTSESQRWVSPTADSPVCVSPKSDSLGWVSSTLDFLGWVSSTSVTCSRAASVSYPSVSSS